MDFLTIIPLFICALNHLPAAAVKDSANNETRLFIYFDKVAINQTQFNLLGKFFSVDGAENTIECKMLESNGIAKESLTPRLWYVDIPKSTNTCSFIITDNKDYTWCQTGIFAVSGSTFIFSTSNYSAIEATTGFNNIHLKTEQFADYIVSRINIESDSSVDGYMCYKEIEPIFNNLTDYSKEIGESIKWNDRYTGHYVTFDYQWNAIKTQYILNYEPEQQLYWPYILGGLMLVSLTSFGVVTFLKFRRDKKIR